MTAPVHPGGERPGGWVEGIGWVAWLHSLPVGTSYEMVNDVGHTCTFGSNYDDRELADRPVIVIGWRDGTTPQAPTVDSVPVPTEALDRLIGCHRFFCKSSTTPCCPAGEWIAAAGVSSDR